jgi:hypothetical protein
MSDSSVSCGFNRHLEERDGKPHTHRGGRMSEAKLEDQR